MNLQVIDNLLSFSIFLYIYNKSKIYAKLLFFVTVSSLSFYEFIDKKMYYFQHNDLNEYNYIGDKCRIITIQYFLIDIFNVSNKSYFFHHLLVLCGLTWISYFNKGYHLNIYLCLGEISSIFFYLNKLEIFTKYSNILFMITFFIFRILLLPILTYIYRFDNSIFVMLCLDNSLHVYWVVNLFKKFAIK